MLATQLVTEGMKRGERAVLAVFEEHPQDYVSRAKDIGFDLESFVRSGDLRRIYLRPLDLSADEILQEILEEVADSGGLIRKARPLGSGAFRSWYRTAIHGGVSFRGRRP